MPVSVAGATIMAVKSLNQNDESEENAPPPTQDPLIVRG